MNDMLSTMMVDLGQKSRTTLPSYPTAVYDDNQIDIS